MDLSFLVLLGKGLGILLLLVAALAIVTGVYFLISWFFLSLERKTRGKARNSYGSLAFLVLLFSMNLADIFAFEIVNDGADWTLYVGMGLYASAVLIGMMSAMRTHTSRRALGVVALAYPVAGILWASFSPWAGVIHSYLHFG